MRKVIVLPIRGEWQEDGSDMVSQPFVFLPYIFYLIEIPGRGCEQASSIDERQPERTDVN